jgi:hypothetical protein
VRRASFILVLVVLLMFLVQPVSSDRGASCGTIIDRFTTGACRIQASNGERIDGNVTAQMMPLDVYIYQDKGYADVSQYQPEEAIYSHRGMISRFDFVSDDNTDWLLVFINNNNLTQRIEYHYRIHDSLGEILIGLAPTIMQVAGVFVLVIIGAVIYHREKSNISY